MIFQILIALSGICWTVVYIDAIRIGFKHKTYAIPFWALALNISWELFHVISFYQGYGLKIQVSFNAIWLVLDTIILYTYFRFGREYFPRNMPTQWFYLWSIVILITAFVLQFAFFKEFGLLLGPNYAAFIQNLLMSVLFIVMLVRRNNCEGQSMTIAVSKLIGTLIPTFLLGLFGIKDYWKPNSFLLVLGFLILIYDLIYIVMLVRVRGKKS